MDAVLMRGFGMVDPEIEAYYALGFEDGRLYLDGAPRLEYVRTLELLGRYLPAPPGMVADIGGGTGVYAKPLSAAGYGVQVVDPMASHVALALERLAPWPESGASVGDARRLHFDDQSFHAAVLLGPLYHLVTVQDRAAAWSEAVRVTKPGGVVIAAAISRFASLLDGVKQGLLDDPQFRKIVEADLATGQHRNADVVGRPDFFTTAYFHHPDELRAEAEASGLVNVAVIGVEGPGWMVEGAEQVDQQAMAARAIETEPTLLGASPHFLAVGERRGAGQLS